MAGNRAAAMQSYSKAKPIAEALAAADAHNMQARGDLAALYLSLGACERQNGDPLPALDDCRRAVAIREELSGANPSNALTRRDLASAYSELAEVYEKLAANKEASAVQQQDNWRVAKEWYDKSLKIWQEMKSNRILGGADAGKPEELARKVANCDSALDSIAKAKVAP
jgi:tetratricopeptide (TPR) repeat protein